MIFLSAGHNSKSKNIKQDPGAVANGYKEGDLTIMFRDKVAKCLKAKGVQFITDSDEESLSMYLDRIKTGSASVVIEYHLDAGPGAATGTTGLIEAEADKHDRMFAAEITAANANILGIKNRGVITEAESHRGRLGLMREDGIICLSELCFISNKHDLDTFIEKSDVLAEKHANIIIKYEDLIS